MLWSVMTKVVDLNQKVDLGRSEVLESAFRINNSGEILASGYFPSITVMANVGWWPISTASIRTDVCVKKSTSISLIAGSADCR